MTTWIYAKKDNITIMRPIVEIDDYIAPPEDKNDLHIFDDSTMCFRMIYDKEMFCKLKTGTWDVRVSMLDKMVHRYSFNAYVVSCGAVGGKPGKPLYVDWNINPTTPFEIETFGVRQKRKIRVKGDK